MSDLVFDDVTVRYGTGRGRLTAVDAVRLTVPAGTVVGLVGESGSGKSTLARAAVGLAPLAGGRILLDGRPLPRRAPVQLVFQDPYSSLDPRMTVGASIAEAIPRRAGVAAKAEVARLLELVGLDPGLAGRYPAGLSGGQRQRVALARALAGRPEVIVADEITSALDVSIQGAVLNLVRDLQRRMRLSMLFISHDLAVVRYVSEIIAVMYLGRIVEYGPAAEVLDDPQHPYTRELLASATHPIGLGAEDAGPAVAETEPADPHRPPAGCRFHPRCPVGPLVHPDRQVCREVEPTPAHRHRALCHFAEPADKPITTRGGAGDPPPAHR
ncbi:ABC transporter ATP-binding protein [Plantactinospora veratri]|uniref:ABC transporter ATP-binding protein n=1 Tax=Plantactinospora veratri TaxID=1436122 RepID=A0ABU7SLG7_9ACTN